MYSLVKLILPVLWMSQSEGMEDVPKIEIDGPAKASALVHGDCEFEHIEEMDLYQLNMRQRDVALGMMSELPGGQYGWFINRFKDVTTNYHRPDVNIEAVLVKKIRSLGYLARKDQISLELYKYNTVDSIMEVMSNHFKEHFPLDWQEREEEFCHSVSKAKEQIHQYVDLYEDYRATYGHLKTWKIKDYINKLLNIENFTLSLDQRNQHETIYRILLKSGFIKSDFQTTRHFSYDPSLLIEHYMDLHKDVDRLVLGCGHHFSQNASDYLGIESESFCGMCELPHFHKDDLTIALQTLDMPDVVANMHDERIWEVLKGRRWQTIADHSWGASLDSPITLKRIYDCLDEDGVFEVWDIDEKMLKTAYEVGFVLFKIIPDKRLFLLKKK